MISKFLLLSSLLCFAETIPARKYKNHVTGEVVTVQPAITPLPPARIRINVARTSVDDSNSHPHFVYLVEVRWNEPEEWADTEAENDDSSKRTINLKCEIKDGVDSGMSHTLLNMTVPAMFTGYDEYFKLPQGHHFFLVCSLRAANALGVESDWTKGERVYINTAIESPKDKESEEGYEESAQLPSPLPISSPTSSPDPVLSLLNSAPERETLAVFEQEPSNAELLALIKQSSWTDLTADSTLAPETVGGAPVVVEAVTTSTTASPGDVSEDEDDENEPSMHTSRVESEATTTFMPKDVALPPFSFEDIEKKVEKAVNAMDTKDAREETFNDLDYFGISKFWIL